MLTIEANKNNSYDLTKAKTSAHISKETVDQVLAFHESLGNKKTPLIQLSGLANDLGVQSIFIKDESHRLGLNAFKGLGASYAMSRQLEKNSKIEVFCTATDGNHGKAVAWMSRKLGKKAVIYMPKGTVSDRVDAIEREGADVHVIDAGYDAAVKKANDEVESFKDTNSWCLIQDTAWDGYEEIPLDITRGYLTQVHEITEQIKDQKIDIIFLQSGVGSWAASILMYVLSFWKNPPLFISVEPHSANCLFRSIQSRKRVSVSNKETTAMAGLDCGTVSTEAWKVLKHGIYGSISIADSLMEEAVRILAHPLKDDMPIKSGESGASPLAALIGLLKSNELDGFKKKIKLNNRSNILLINTEGDTDRSNYERILSSSQ
ncbi:MAG: diaminopropionate ammonia-lyase [Candidatus Thalassarchaeaceae archaeon]